ncbi:MAG TPA: FxLYD domain-containing protein [Armatimonadota bacterium]|nr:FxLYD domain-containing protein [Armatimonadota bacterium]
MKEQNQAAAAERLPGMQRALGIVMALVAVCLVFVLFLWHSQAKPSRTSYRDLAITRSAVVLNKKTGKLVWTGIVVNHGSEPAPAPWVVVNLYDPAGDGVDTGQATTTVKSIRGGGSLGYSTIFDSRGNNMRAEPHLEEPNSRPLGM